MMKPMAATGHRKGSESSTSIKPRLHGESLSLEVYDSLSFSDPLPSNVGLSPGLTQDLGHGLFFLAVLNLH